MSPVRKGLLKRPEDWRGSSYNNSALDNATVAACPIQIDYVRLPLGYRAREKPTDRKALSVATCFTDTISPVLLTRSLFAHRARAKKSNQSSPRSPRRQRVARSAG